LPSTASIVKAIALLAFLAPLLASTGVEALTAAGPPAINVSQVVIDIRSQLEAISKSKVPLREAAQVYENLSSCSRPGMLRDLALSLARALSEGDVGKAGSLLKKLQERMLLNPREVAGCGQHVVYKAILYSLYTPTSLGLLDTGGDAGELADTLSLGLARILGLEKGSVRRWIGVCSSGSEAALLAAVIATDPSDNPLLGDINETMHMNPDCLVVAAAFEPPLPPESARRILSLWSITHGYTWSAEVYEEAARLVRDNPLEAAGLVVLLEALYPERFEAVSRLTSNRIEEALNPLGELQSLVHDPKSIHNPLLSLLALRATRERELIQALAASAKKHNNTYCGLVPRLANRTLHLHTEDSIELLGSAVSLCTAVTHDWRLLTILLSYNPFTPLDPWLMEDSAPPHLKALLRLDARESGRLVRPVARDVASKLLSTIKAESPRDAVRAALDYDQLSALVENMSRGMGVEGVLRAIGLAARAASLRYEDGLFLVHYATVHNIAEALLEKHVPELAEGGRGAFSERIEELYEWAIGEREELAVSLFNESSLKASLKEAARRLEELAERLRNHSSGEAASAASIADLLARAALELRNGSIEEALRDLSRLQPNTSSPMPAGLLGKIAESIASSIGLSPEEAARIISGLLSNASGTPITVNLSEVVGPGRLQSSGGGGGKALSHAAGRLVEAAIRASMESIKSLKTGVHGRPRVVKIVGLEDLLSSLDYSGVNSLVEVTARLLEMGGEGEGNGAGASGGVAPGISGVGGLGGLGAVRVGIKVGWGRVIPLLVLLPLLLLLARHFERVRRLIAVRVASLRLRGVEAEAAGADGEEEVRRLFSGMLLALSRVYGERGAGETHREYSRRLRGRIRGLYSDAAGIYERARFSSSIPQGATERMKRILAELRRLLARGG